MSTRFRTTIQGRAPIVAAVTKRTDTLIRWLFLLLGLVATVIIFRVAGDAALSRSTRFVQLALWGIVVAGVGVTVDIATPFPDRVPLLPRLGRAPRPAGPAVANPDPITAPSTPVVFGLAINPTLGALAGATVVALVTGAFGYALARTAHTDGGLLLYVVFAAACLVELRSIFRLFTSRRALTLDADAVTLGLPLGHLPPTTVPRQAVVSAEISTGSPSKIALVDQGGRRFELRPDHLSLPDLPGYIAAMWPEVPWHEMPKSRRRI